MIKKSNDFLNLPIMSCNEGKNIATTKKFLIDSSTKKAVALIVQDDEYYKGIKILPVDLIIGVGKDALIINSTKNIVPYTNISTAEELLKLQINIINTVVINKHGEKVGIVKEFELDDNYNIINIIVENNSNISSISINQITVFGKNYTIIDDDIDNNTIIEKENITQIPEKQDIDLEQYFVFIDSAFKKDFNIGNKIYSKGTIFTNEILNEISSLAPDKLIELVNVLE